MAKEMSGGIFSWGTGKSERLGGYFGKGKYGYHARIDRANKIFDFVNWNFPSAVAYKEVRKRADNLFKDRIGYRK